MIHVQSTSGTNLPADVTREDWGDKASVERPFRVLATFLKQRRRDCIVELAQETIAACTPQRAVNKLYRDELLAATFLHRFGPLIIR